MYLYVHISIIYYIVVVQLSLLPGVGARAADEADEDPVRVVPGHPAAAGRRRRTPAADAAQEWERLKVG
jgi:hypothetical protein